MTATYDDTRALPKDEVRFRLGDIVVAPESAALYSDEAILAELARQDGDISGATSALASGLVARFANMPVKWSTPGQSFDFSGRLKAWQSLVIAPTPEQAASSPISFVPVSFSDLPPAGSEYGR